MRKLFTAILLLFAAALVANPQTNTFCANNLACTVTAAWGFTQQITSSVSTGTAPFSIASTTVVPNLNAQLHNGLTAPGSAIVGISDTQSLTNKTFDISANTLKTATNTAGHLPRNNGTQYVDAQLGFSDLGGTASTSQIGTGTPAAGKYVDGGSGAWTTLPSGGPTTAYLTSNFSQTGTGLTNVSGLTFSVSANTKYKISCDLDYQVSGNGIQIQWAGPASPTFVTYDMSAVLTTGSATVSPGVATAFSTALSGNTTGVTGTNLPLHLSMTLSNGANAGTVQLQAASTGATATVTIIPGSCSMQQ